MFFCLCGNILSPIRNFQQKEKHSVAWRKFGLDHKVKYIFLVEKNQFFRQHVGGGDWKKRKGNREWVLTSPPFPTPRAYQCVQHARRAGKESIGGLLEEGLLRARQLLNSLLTQVHLLSSSWVTAFLTTKETRKPNLPQRQKASPAHTAHKEKSSLKRSQSLKAGLICPGTPLR